PTPQTLQDIHNPTQKLITARGRIHNRSTPFPARNARLTVKGAMNLLIVTLLKTGMAINCSPPKRFVIITRQIKAIEPKKIVTESRRFSTAAVIASNKGRTPTYIAGPMLLEYPQ